MKPSKGASQSFASAVHKLGGQMLTVRCVESRYTMNYGKGAKPGETCGCGLYLRAKLPNGEGKYPAVVCGVCDKAFDFPLIVRGPA